MSKKIIITKDAPAPIGPYSQAIFVGEFLYISGQIALIPESGALDNQNLAHETKRVMQNLHAILTAASLDFSNVIKASIFLKSMDDFPEINEIYGSYFDDSPPVRETVEVSRLPKDVHIEISMIAHGGK